ncbi:MAG: adenosine deaminase family protein [Candidatus Wallbacteria bacterium]
MTLKLTREQIMKLPKTDLHVHLDGSVSSQTIVELAKAQKVDLVKESKELGIGNLISGTAEELDEKVFKHEYSSLMEYLIPFELVNCVLRTPESLEEVAYRMACDEFNEGVRYFEVRFAPQKHWRRDLGWEDIIKSVDKGLRRAMDEFNSKDGVKKNGEMPYRCAMILCAMRMIGPNMGDYFSTLYDLHTGDDLQSLSQMAANEIAQLAIDSMKKGYLVVGFDLAGREDGYPAAVYSESFELCYNSGVQTTCHAGEAYGPESIMGAIKYCNVRRIGHGTHLFEWEKIQRRNPDGSEMTKEQKIDYMRLVAERMARERTTIEVCLKSNSQTSPDLRDISKHPVRDFLKYNLRVALSTDNRVISRVSVTDEYISLIKNFPVSVKELRNLCLAGFKGAFFPGSYANHREYMRKSIDFYDVAFNNYIAKGTHIDKLEMVEIA